MFPLSALLIGLGTALVLSGAVDLARPAELSGAGLGERLPADGPTPARRGAA